MHYLEESHLGIRGLCWEHALALGVVSPTWLTRTASRQFVFQVSVGVTCEWHCLDVQRSEMSAHKSRIAILQDTYCDVVTVQVLTEGFSGIPSHLHLQCMTRSQWVHTPSNGSLHHENIAGERLWRDGNGGKRPVPHWMQDKEKKDFWCNIEYYQNALNHHSLAWIDMSWHTCYQPNVECWYWSCKLCAVGTDQLEWILKNMLLLITG